MLVGAYIDFLAAQPTYVRLIQRASMEDSDRLGRAAAHEHALGEGLSVLANLLDVNGFRSVDPRQLFISCRRSSEPRVLLSAKFACLNLATPLWVVYIGQWIGSSVNGYSGQAGIARRVDLLVGGQGQGCGGWDEPAVGLAWAMWQYEVVSSDLGGDGHGRLPPGRADRSQWRSRHRQVNQGEPSQGGDHPMASVRPWCSRMRHDGPFMLMTTARCKSLSRMAAATTASPPNSSAQLLWERLVVTMVDEECS